jgi:hypothetical protein
LNGDEAAWSLARGVGSYEDTLPVEVRHMIPRDRHPRASPTDAATGFLKISSGDILPVNHFALPEQLDFVNEDGIRLTVGRNRLLIL